MMKKLAFLGACLLTMACSSEQYPSDAPARGDGLTVKLSASGGSYNLTEGGKTRAADGLYTGETGFSGGETVKVFKMVGEDTESADYNVGAPSDGRSDLTAAGDELRYPASGTTTLYAVYPSTSTESHVVKHDQRSDADYKASDLMYAPAVNVTKEQRAQVQNLDFKHQLVKLKVVVNKTADVGQVKGVTLMNVKRKAAVTVASTGMTVGEATATVSGDDGYSDTEATNNSILVSGQETAAPGVAETYEYACVFPAQAWAEADFIKIEADTKTTTYKLTKSFTAGNFYQLTVTLNGLALGSTVTIDNWTGNESICNVHPAVPGGGTLKISDIADMTYTGSPLTPATAPTVKNAQNETLSAGTDYELTYFSNTNAGQAIVLASGKGTYDGQIGFAGFNILKAVPTVTPSPTELTISGLNATGTFTVTRSGDGVITATSSDTGVATVSVNQATREVTVTSVAEGNATITVTVGEGTNYQAYTATDKTVAVTVEEAADITAMKADALSSNALWKVAQYNVAQGGTSFVSSHSTSSQYVFSWADAQTINIPGYHLPTWAEQVRIIPSTNASANGTNWFSAVKNTPTAMDSNSGKGWYTANPANNVYAVRIVDGVLTAWHYQLVTSPCSGLQIDSYVLAYQHTGAGDTWTEAEMKVILASLPSSSVWTTAAANESPESNSSTSSRCTRILPACGYTISGSGDATTLVGSYGTYWSATANGGSNAFRWDFISGYLCESQDAQGRGFSVRLFRD